MPVNGIQHILKVDLIRRRKVQILFKTVVSDSRYTASVEIANDKSFSGMCITERRVLYVNIGNKYPMLN